MNACPEHQETLLLDVYGELGPDQSSEWINHLEACRRCRDERGRITRMLENIRQVDVPFEMSQEEVRTFEHRVMRRLKEKETVVRNQSNWLAGRRKWLPGLVAASIILAVGWFGSDLLHQAPLHRDNPQEEKVIVQNLEVIRNLDLLEEMDEVQMLVKVVDGKESI